MQYFWMKEVELSWHLMGKEASEVRAETSIHPTLHGPFLPPNHETTLGNVGAVRNTITFSTVRQSVLTCRIPSMPFIFSSRLFQKNDYSAQQAHY
jgi:hypothetical protein